MTVDYSTPARFKQFIKKEETGEISEGYVTIMWENVYHIEELLYPETFGSIHRPLSVIVMDDRSHLIVAMDYNSLEQLWAGYILYKKQIRYFLPLN
jgi:hypothetical protein